MQQDAAAAQSDGRRTPPGRQPLLQRLLRSQEKPYPVLREVLTGAGVVLLVLAILWGFTGQPLWRSPIVVVESGSMMHCTNGVGIPLGRDCDSDRLGRIGTIDPGDLILVKDVDGPGDVATFAGGGKDHYGRPGDVIVFRPDGQEGRTPVIHRAQFWLQVNPDGTFTIEELGLVGVDDLDQPEVRELGLTADYDDTMRDPALNAVCGPVGPGRSGFITRGDNNNAADQGSHSQIANCPVKTTWVLGKARGEVPWLGLVKLLFADLMTGTGNYRAAAGDSKAFLWVTLGVLIGGPYVYERVKMRRQQAKEPPNPPSPPDPPSPPTPPTPPAT